MGRSSRFRAELRRLNEPDLLAVPSNTTIRDLEGETPQWSGRGPHPKRAFEPVRAWSKSLPQGAWRRIEVGDGERGPQFVELVATRVVARTDRRRIGPEELLVVIRGLDENGVTKHDSYLSDAPAETLPGCWRGWPRPSIGSSAACSAARARRGWPDTRCGPGRGGITTRRCR